MNLDNKVALVTGGASGLGQATVEKFVEKGAKTVILDINEDNANKIAIASSWPGSQSRIILCILKKVSFY